ncbi:MAG TPA: aminotransferase class IV, partial [Ignavibacteriaceae bacterium]
RNAITDLKAYREDCDDILIVRNGTITDSSIANIVLYDGKNWVTPEFPLLEGTARERLLHTGRIISKDIKLDNIKMFSHFRLVNSMLDFDEQEMIGISALK